MAFIDAMNSITIAKLLHYAHSVPDFKSDSILQNYWKLLKHSARSIEFQDELTICALAHMAYGWMPTILKKYRSPQNVLLFWNEVNRGSIDVSFLNSVKTSINNSIIGGSKLLHFINPNEYAIFDKKVYTAITGHKNYIQTNNCSNYSTYILKLRELINDAAELKMYLINEKSIPEDTSTLRCMEMCLFYRQ